jgi:hypothetical protein
MKQAIKFQNFRLPMEQMATYLKFAQQRAAETGESIDYLVNSIVIGLGRGSIKILDNLQIDVGRFNQLVKDGATYADALSILMADELGDSTEQVVSAVEQLNVELENMKNLASVGLAPLITDAIELGKTIVKYLPALKVTAYLWERIASMAGYDPYAEFSKGTGPCKK